MRKKRILDKYNGRKLEWLHDSFLFIVLMAAAVILFRFVIGMAIVRGDSMKPSLEDGTVVVYLRPVWEYKPGDVVSVRVPSGDYYVKRVIAAGGESFGDGTRSKLDTEALTGLLKQIYDDTGIEPNTIPVEALASYATYRKERFSLQRAVIAAALAAGCAIFARRSARKRRSTSGQ